MNETLEKLVRERMAYILKHKEELLGAWVAAIGTHPTEAMLVQQDLDGKLNFWVEVKTDRCLTHRNELAALKEENRILLDRIQMIPKHVSRWLTINQTVTEAFREKLGRALYTYLTEGP